MADLVEDRALEEVWPRHLHAIRLARPGLPGLPIADLRVGSKQEHVALAGLVGLERQHKARIVRVALQGERQFGRGAEPFAVDAPPVGTCEIVLLEEIIDLPPIISIVGRLVEKREPALPVERNLPPCMKWRSSILSRGVVSAIERDYDAQRQRS